MAFCYERGKFWWVGYVDETGEPVREPSKILLGRTKAERRDSEFRALSYARELEERAVRVRSGVSVREVRPMLFEDLAEKYLTIRASRKSSVGSIESRVRGHIIPHFKGRLAHTILAADVDEFLGLRAKGAPCRGCGETGCHG